MKIFSILFLGTCITFADSLFPYSAIALGLWTLGAAIVMNYQELRR